MNKVLGLDDKYDQQQYTSTFSFKLKSAAGGGVDLEASRLSKKKKTSILDSRDYWPPLAFRFFDS